MKKSLLFFGAALISASMSAQSTFVDICAPFGELSTGTINVSASANTPSTSQILNDVRRAGENNSIYGVYINSGINEGFGEPFHRSYIDTLRVANKTIDGKVYNVEMTVTGVQQEKATSVYGIYDEANQTITFPKQSCYKHQVGNFDFAGFVNKGNDQYSAVENLILAVQENGDLKLANCDAWGIIVTEGQYANQFVNHSIGAVLYKPNAVMTGVQRFSSEKKNNLNTPIYIKDENRNLEVYNVFGGKVLVNVDNDDEFVKMPTGQNLQGTSQKQKEEGHGDYYTLLGYTVDSDGRPGIDENLDYVAGEFEKTESGDMLNNTIKFAPFTIATEPDSENRRYFYGLLENIRFVRTDKAYTAGVANVTETIKPINNGKYYNLSGQEVSKNYKGIVIVNGKKMVNK